MATETTSVFRTNAVYPPGEYLAEDLEARGMTQLALAKAMGRPVHVVNDIIRGQKVITAEPPSS